MNKFKKKYFKKNKRLLSKFWVLKIAGKTYTSILALLFRSDQGRDILVVIFWGEILKTEIVNLLIHIESKFKSP